MSDRETDTHVNPQEITNYLYLYRRWLLCLFQCISVFLTDCTQKVPLFGLENPTRYSANLFHEIHAFGVIRIFLNYFFCSKLSLDDGDDDDDDDDDDKLFWQNV